MLQESEEEEMETFGIEMNHWVDTSVFSRSTSRLT